MTRNSDATDVVFLLSLDFVTRGSMSICDEALTDLAQEIESDLNTHGARLMFEVDNPTLAQKIINYFKTSGFERFLSNYQGLNIETPDRHPFI